MEIIDLQKQFEVKRNKDAKRFEFISVDNNSVSYTVGFNEVDNEADAYIAVWKAIQLQNNTVCAKCAGTGIIGNGPTSYNQQKCSCAAGVKF